MLKLTGGQFYSILCEVIPLYVALVLGYGSLRWWRIVTPEQSAGICRFNAIVAIPALVLKLIAFNNPYTMNNRLIAAYCLANALLLVALCAWAWCTKLGGLDWVITLFQLTVLPNVVNVGLPVLTPLSSVTGPQILVAILIGEILWLSPVLCLYELRDAMKPRTAQVQSGRDRVRDVPPCDVSAVSAVSAAAVPGNIGNELIPGLSEAERDGWRLEVGDGGAASKQKQQLQEEELQAVEVGTGESEVSVRDCEIQEENGHKVAPCSSTVSFKEIAVSVVKRMLRLPLTYATFVGFVYSLVACRWSKFETPRILYNSLDIISRTAIGLAMYSIGLFMAGEKKLVSSWWVALYGAICRFIVSPGIMGLASFLLGLHGETLRLTILQAALPQATVSFIFASDYNLHVGVFSTAVSLQTLVCLPVVLVYCAVLGL